MKIVIKDIPEEGQCIHADSQSDGWFRQILADSLKEAYQQGDKSSLDFQLFRTGRNIDCSGEVMLDCHPCCSRCLKVFGSHRNIPIHRTLAPLYESERQLKLEEEDDVALVKEDLEFSFYEGDKFNLGKIIQEEVILALPMQPLCKTSCKGLCHRCGKDLNAGPCRCGEKHEDPRWSPLKTFKRKLQRS